MSRFRPAVERLAPYVPGEQPPDDAAVVKLNTNENPYPPSPRALEAIRTADPDALRRYPQPMADGFRRAAGDALGVDPDWILAGNGSDDLLTMLFRAVTGPGRPVAYATPTYVLYRTLAAMQEAPVMEARYDEAYAVPVDALVAARAALTIVAHPNSPSGTAATPDELAELAERTAGVVAIDEAYVAFADHDALDLVRRHDHVLVLRTLSKGHGLAGLRIGYGVGRPDLLAGLARVKDSYNVDALAARAGAAAIRDTDYTRSTVARIRASRDRLTARLNELGCRVWPSQANFVLVRPPGGDASRLHAALRADGILVRYFAEPGLDDKLRVTVGTDPQHDRLTAALARLIG